MTIPTSMRSLTAHIRATAASLGFDPVGITSADRFEDAEQVILERLGKGLMDGLPWFHEKRVRRGCSPQEILPGARSIIALALPYGGQTPGPPDDGRPRGRISRYAWGEDYHKVIERRLKVLVGEIRTMGGAVRQYVDYGPMPDRAVAARAGVGWYGKNTNVLTSGHGSWVFLAELVTDLDLQADTPLKKTCGRCTACIPSCPTGAIVAPYVIDNTRCISYHTIENKGPIPREMRALMGDWVFGCDICQDVCPVNHRTGARLPLAADPHSAAVGAFQPPSAERTWPDLAGLLCLSKEDFDRRFRGTAIRRAGWAGLLRNACIALGNSGALEAVKPLSAALLHEAPLVRGHAAWALGRLGGPSAAAALGAALSGEPDVWVRDEIAAALEALI